VWIKSTLFVFEGFPNLDTSQIDDEKYNQGMKLSHILKEKKFHSNNDNLKFPCCMIMIAKDTFLKFKTKPFMRIVLNGTAKFSSTERTIKRYCTMK